MAIDVELESWTRNWSSSNPKVRAYLRYATAQRKKGLQHAAPDLVEWDRVNGKRLLLWDNAACGDALRLHQARQFLGQFAGIVNGVKFRALHAVPAEVKNENGTVRAVDSDRPREYWTARDIHRSGDHRRLMIQTLTVQMRRIADQLKIWKTSAAEWRTIAAELERVVLG